MAGVNCVTVLTPNGRRQSVKVTPNSTILQVLEEVCTKHDFDPQEYDIRHHSHIMDVTMTIQFSRLPNNAQLEMVKAKKIRRESEVLVNIQTESGNRLSGSFLPSESLWDVLIKLCSDAAENDKQPALLYMRQEICGSKNLKTTTLRSLGLTSGRALLRLTFKSVEEKEVPRQSDVTNKPVNFSAASSSDPNHPVSADFAGSLPTNTSLQPLNKEQDTKEKIQKETASVKTTDPSSLRRSPLNVKGEKPSAKLSEKKEPDSNTKHQSPADVVCKKQQTETSRLSPHNEKHEEMKFTPKELTARDTSLEVLESEIEPRDRNPVVFKHGSHQPSVGEDLPDEFFELTLDEVQYLYRELRSKRTDMDDAPLQTSAIRKLEESKKILNNLHKYKRAVLRIQFPDQVILQGSFSPVETIESVKEFVRGYLANPGASFDLYTTPPKEILEPSARLIEVNCVPCALLHFGLPEGVQENVHYLREDVMRELSSAEAAAAALTLSRGLPATVPEKRSVPSTSGVQQSRASTSGVQVSKHNKESSPSSSKTDARPAGGPNGKVPKWFKVGPK